MIISIIFSMLILNGLAVLMMFRYCLYSRETISFSSALRNKLSISGIVAFFADTIGMGSFAVNIFLAKLFSTFRDEELPAMTNLAQVIPGMIEAVFFITQFQVDFLSLIVLVSGTCLGGIIGAYTMTKLNKQVLSMTMMGAFSVIIVLLLLAQLHILPMDGSLQVLRGGKLLLGFIALGIAGALTAAGVGLFVMVQAVLFMLNMSPLVAFPIMTIAGALQQPMTAMIFLKQPGLPIGKILWLSISGCIGVFMGLAVLSHLNVQWLRWLLLLIVCYNLLAISRVFFFIKKLRVEPAHC